MFKVEIKKDNLITNYSEFKTVNDCMTWIDENKDYFPDGFLSEIINITELKQFQSDEAKGLKNQEIGRIVLAKIYAINAQKTRLNLLTSEQLTAMLSDNTLKTVERLLLNGSLSSALALIQAMPDQHFNSENKQMILDYINNTK
jgi:hypothetical protein